MDFNPHPYQRVGIEAIISKPGVALWYEMGLGKTATTLAAINELLYDRFTAQRVLIIAPYRVAEATWQDEAARWDNLRHLTFSTVLGPAETRREALETPADIYIINRENVPWLVEHCGRRWPFDTVVIDEASSFKNHAAQRFKALRRVRPRIHRIIELTGTPAPNNLLDIWAQVYLLDQGERLGRYFTHYRQDYFQPDKRSATQIYSWAPRPGAEEAIKAAIADVVLSVQAADHLQLPDKIVEDIPVKLDAPAAERYHTLERTCLLELDGEDITAQQAAALTNKLLQLCNGSIYDDAKEAHEVHRCKLERWSELIDALGGQKALVFYSFQSDLSSLTLELETRHKGLRFAVLRSAAEATAWNAGELDVLLAQPASCAYGLNLQQGGHHVVWFGLPWSLELYEQANARLYRQGQEHPVIIHRLLVKGGEDEHVAAALARKDTTQQALVQGLKARIKRAREE